MNRQGSLVETAQEESRLRSTMKDDPPQPKISFLRTKRFWLRWAVPGLLLALWVEGMLFWNEVSAYYYTPFSESHHTLAVGRGIAAYSSYRWFYPMGIPTSHGWGNFQYYFGHSSGLQIFPRPIEYSFISSDSESYERVIRLPLWIPLILWLLVAHLWSRHHKRKQAEHP
ncbi:MAG: hypothetical protein CFE26_11905 [Verrucomicrobiales bacterium VVV1]|nr:MAG: hypothetical protein CFE26_11905 [Verrucomicrobiales bacterium VVV1]